MERASYRTAFGEGAVVHDGREVTAIELPQRHAAYPDSTPPREIQSVVEALEAYYAGKASLVAPAWMIAVAGTTPLLEDIYTHVARIRPGTTETYAEVAAAVGRPRAARAVGAAMARNPFPPVIPCHRVIGSGGSMRGYGGGIDQKRQLLDMEATGAG